MPKSIKMFKGEEETFVHPGAVENYERAGWSKVVEPVLAVEPTVEIDAPSMESATVETHKLASPTIEKSADGPSSKRKSRAKQK